MTITLPDNWADVKLADFQEMDLAENIYEKVAILSDQDPDVIRDTDVPSFVRIEAALAWIVELPKEEECKEVITIDEVEYTRIKLSTLSNGQWMDLITWGKKGLQELHKIMATLYPDDTDRNKRAELFRTRMNAQDAYSALVFFSLIKSKSLVNIEAYLQVEIIKAEMISKMKTSLSVNKD